MKPESLKKRQQAKVRRIRQLQLLESKHKWLQYYFNATATRRREVA